MARARKSAPKFSAADAVAAATRIISRASDSEIDEIDWLHNPLTEREATLRAAIITRIESENSIGFAAGPGKILFALWDLVGGIGVGIRATRPVVAGADIARAINKWRDACDEKAAARNRAEQRRLIELARRDMCGNP